MKKILLLALVLSAITVPATLFAQTAAQEYTVQTVTGIVTQEVSAGKWEAVTAGKKLAPSAVINTGLNSTLILKGGDSTVTIRAMQKGTVASLVSASAAGTTGIKLGATITESKVNTDNAQGRTNISTASTRASDATEDVEWVEDKKKE